MNKLDTKDRIRVVQMLCDGQSIRAISLIMGSSKNTVAKLLFDAGEICAEYQNEVLCGLNCERVQINKIWSFSDTNQKNITKGGGAQEGIGDTWTWTAIDVDRKLVISWMVDGRDGQNDMAFIDDLRSRVVIRGQLKGDGQEARFEAVGSTLGGDVSFAQFGKIPSAASDSFFDHSSRTEKRSIRKKVESHANGVALHFMYYNFVRIHPALQSSPAMAAGITDKLWKVSDIVSLLEEYEAL